MNYNVPLVVGPGGIQNAVAVDSLDGGVKAVSDFFRAAADAAKAANPRANGKAFLIKPGKMAAFREIEGNEKFERIELIPSPPGRPVDTALKGERPNNERHFVVIQTAA